MIDKKYPEDSRDMSRPKMASFEFCSFHVKFMLAFRELMKI